VDKRLMGHRAMVDMVENKNLCPCQESNPNFLVIQSMA
jgi:hypothetical protein